MLFAALTIPAAAQTHEHRLERTERREGGRDRGNDAPQFKSASEMYWDAVRATTGPIGFPQAVPDDELTVRSRALSRRSERAVFASIPYLMPPPAPMYVPVYVPGPVVYVPLPTAPTQNTADVSITPAPRRPEKIYVIPGCYGGNRPPDPTALPAGCDIKKLRVSTW